MILFKIIRLNLLIFSLITIYSCALSPGINENPTQPEFSENIQTQNIDVKINDLSTLTFNDIELKQRSYK